MRTENNPTNEAKATNPDQSRPDVINGESEAPITRREYSEGMAMVMAMVTARQDMISKGAKKRVSAEGFFKEGTCGYLEAVVYDLARLCAALTGSSQRERKDAKAEVRELIKRGNGV
ncbi:MAG: hypothetical protein H6943_05030 [Zoogloeaceae bacterium]|nr:hypothetical protein [Zoogloeaceae bacterium]